MNDLANTRILVLRAGRIGDTIFTLGLVDALCKHFGGRCRLDWLVLPLCKQLFTHDPRVNHVFTISSRKTPLLFNRDKKRLIAHSKQYPYDIIINAESDHFFNDLMKRLQGEIKLGEPYHTLPPIPQGEHAVVTNNRLLEPLDIDTTQAAPKLYAGDVSPLQAKFHLPNDYIVVSPANSHTENNRNASRTWPPAHWHSLINSLQQSVQVVLIGGPSDKAFIEQIGELDTGVINLVGQTHIPELIDVIAHANVLVSTDTGTSHIAGATNTPVIALFGPSDYQQTGPYPTAENRVEILSVYHKNPYTVHDTSISKENAMAAIQPKGVENAVIDLLEIN